MTDKTKEFQRINGPRVEKIHRMLDTIEKSSRSLRVDPTDLLQTLRDRLTGDEHDNGGSPPDVPNRPVATQPVEREALPLKNLSTQQLVDRMIACGFELGKRRT